MTTTATPMMQQWHSCKAQAKDALVFFRLGDFYEAFHDDAKIASKELSLTLTARQTIPMCGVPFHTAEGYIDKLVSKGYKVAIVEQTEDPKSAKGLVRREITRIVTPGTIMGSSLLSDKKNNFFVSISEVKQKLGLAILDLSTAECKVKEFENKQELIDELCRLKPSELLVPKSYDFLKNLSHLFPFVANVKEPLDYRLSFDVLTAHFDVQNLDGFGLRSKEPAICAAGSLFLYLKEELNLSLEHIFTIQSDISVEFMGIDRSTLRNLDLEALANLLDETSTPMGARLLKTWVQYPLLNCEAIEARQNEIVKFLEDNEKRVKAQDLLSKVRDIERLSMKVSSRIASPRDVLALGLSLHHLPQIAELLELTIFDASALAAYILDRIVENPPLRMGEGDIFKTGCNRDLDDLREAAQSATSWMARYQTTLREETGLKTLKVGYTRAFGYYIEVSRLQSEKIPLHFHRKQTLTNAERFITEELRTFEQKVLSAEEKSKALEAQMFDEMLSQIAEQVPSICHAAKAIAHSDALLSLALVADRHNWARPSVDLSDTIEISGGRHPLIEQHIGSALFIRNDTHLSPEQQLILITGPNMAGKSTYIRQIALIVILAQMGSFVPAKSARIGLVDKVFSRIGASDDLARGQSTFMVEMAETANILNNATSRSLVLLDEIGRGTSTYDGISIAWSVAEYLLTTHRKQAKTLFATHYWELTKLENEFPQAANFQTAIQETNGHIVFLHKIVRGGTDKSYGIHVAKLAGLPPKALKRAQEMLKELEKKQASNQPSLFTVEPQEHPALLQLTQLDVLNMTPLQAHHKLCELCHLIQNV